MMQDPVPILKEILQILKEIKEELQKGNELNERMAGMFGGLSDK